MAPELIFGAMVLVPTVLLMVLRVNATLVFLSLCLGYVLIQFVAEEANSFFDLFSWDAGQAVSADNATVKIILLLLPVVLTTIFMIRTVHGHSKLLLNLLPAAGVGLLGSLMLVPLLSGDLSYSITDSTMWEKIQQAQTLIVGVCALICLFVLWLQRPKAGHDGKHSKHKH